MIPFLACLFPLLPLLKWGQGYYFDWHNHLWMIGYTGEYFKQHLSFPLTFAASPGVSYPAPLFYGNWFFPLAGIFSLVLGASLALRVLMFCLFLIQFYSLEKLFREVTSFKVARAIACLSVWAIYPLTNLYNRGAIPELFATSLLLSGVAQGLHWIYFPKEEDRLKVFAKLSLIFAFAFGSHPITAVYGGVALLLIILVTALTSPNRKAHWIFWGSLLGTVFLLISPWIYVMQTLGSKVFVASTAREITFHPELNSLWVRLIPVAYDPRSVIAGAGVSAPYLDAQAPFPFFLLIVGLILVSWKTKARNHKTALMVFSLGMTLFLLVLSVNPALWSSLPSVATVIQFPFRLIPYLTLFSVVGLFSLFSIFKVDFSKRAPQTILTIAVTLACLNVFQKFPRARAVEQPEAPFTLLAPGTVPKIDYTTPFQYPKSSESKLPVKLMNFPAQNNPKIALELTEKSYVQTDLAAFLWNHLKLNGQLVPDNKLFSDPNLLLGLELEPGKYEIEYIFEVPLVWKILHLFSILLFASLCLQLLVERYFALMGQRLSKSYGTA